MKVLSGEMKPDSGIVSYYGTSVDLCQPADLAKRRAVLPQATQLAFPFTALEIARMGAVAHGALNPSEEARKALSRVGLRGFESRPYPSMSGGEQQMLAIGRALMSKPRLLLLDEPTLGLAPLIIAQIFEIIQAIRAEGVTVFLVEQNANHALKLSDRAYVMVNGQIRMTGTGQELLANDEVRNAYLGGH